MSHRVIIYTKPGCHLCDDVREDLRLLEYETDMTVETVDITTSPALLSRFRTLIPVVDVDGGPLLTPPITIRRLREALAAVHPSSDAAAPGRSNSKA